MKSSNHLTRLRNAKACGSVARFFMLALALVHLIVPICHAQVHVHGAHELGKLVVTTNPAMRNIDVNTRQR